MRDKMIRVLQVLLWGMALFLGLPMALRFAGLALYLVANGFDGLALTDCLRAAADLLPLGVCTALTVMSIWRLTSWYVPAWWWGIAASMLAVLWALWLMDVAAAAETMVLAMPSLVIAVVIVALNALWHLLERKKETEESPNEQEA
nr:hypothetical protein [Clostridia bacterium]